MQLGVAWGSAGQMTSQAPQLASSVVVEISQPLAGSVSQSAKPRSQEAMLQTPEVHDAEAFSKWQALSQEPQCSGLDEVSTSQPFAYSRSQSAKPGAQLATSQAPLEHLACAWAVLVQAVVQSPQCSVSLSVSKHCPLQQVLPGLHACVSVQPGTHAAPSHSVPSGQSLSAAQPMH